MTKMLPLEFTGPAKLGDRLKGGPGLLPATSSPADVAGAHHPLPN
jgi:hypothetical protein